MRMLTAAVLVLAASSCQPLSDFRSIDGTGNNLTNDQAGAAFVELKRLSPNAYEDGISAPAGADRPNARAISNAVAAQTGDIFNSKGVSDMVWQWGQFIDHDVGLTEGKGENFNIAVPRGDQFFDPFQSGLAEIPLTRAINSEESGVREQINEITSWVDGSMVYGSDIEMANSLRMLDGSGKMKVSAGNLLPIDADGNFQAGDIRVNEQLGLISMHTLFVREHNTICDWLKKKFPKMSGEERYQQARAIVGATIQHITYQEWLPVVLGKKLPKYRGYNPAVDPDLANEFSGAAFRFGHTMLANNLLRLDADLNEIAEGHISLKDAFFVPNKIVTEGGISPVLRGLAKQRAQELDAKVVDGVRNFLFGPPGAGGFDLASLNIQRGRDHGLGSLNEVREALGLRAHRNFRRMTRDRAVASDFASVYDNVDQVDLWIGGLAEKKVRGGLVGQTFNKIIADQFKRLRDGDRFYYESYLPDYMLKFVKKQTLASVIRRNTDIGSELQDNVFFAE